ncbi:MAG: uridine phosphorylase [Desulfurococcales archaeon]|nr:uridine phosphorylase [Desulfurococcales archaeon]
MWVLEERMRSASLAMGEGGLQYHIQARPGDVAPYVLLPGDPQRADIISSLWDNAKLIAYHREFKTYTGRYKGTPISVTSTGIGAPSAVIAVEELLRVGANTFIRVGTMGAIQSGVRVGDIVIGVAAVRLEGASKDYVRPEYPAHANYEVILALVEAAERLGVRYHLGVVASTDTFYLGQTRPGLGGYMNSESARRLPDLVEAGVLGFEMEASAIFTVSSIYGARAGCVCAAIANRVTNEFIPGRGVLDASKVASEAVHILNLIDKKKREAGKRWASISMMKDLNI